LLGKEGKGHTHQLRGLGQTVLRPSRKVHFGLKKIGTHGPGNLTKLSQHSLPVPNLQSHQSVGIGLHLMQLRINRSPQRRALQNRNTNANILIDYELPLIIPQHRLMHKALGHLLGIGRQSKACHQTHHAKDPAQEGVLGK